MMAIVGPVGAETQAAKELIAIRVSTARFIFNPSIYLFIFDFIHFVNSGYAVVLNCPMNWRAVLLAEFANPMRNFVHKGNTVHSTHSNTKQQAVVAMLAPWVVEARHMLLLEALNTPLVVNSKQLHKGNHSQGHSSHPSSPAPNCHPILGRKLLDANLLHTHHRSLRHGHHQQRPPSRHYLLGLSWEQTYINLLSPVGLERI
jgi:hypothetical protein